MLKRLLALGIIALLLFSGGVVSSQEPHKEALHAHYELYTQARDAFGSHVLRHHEDHPVVSGKLALVEEVRLPVIHYPLPLNYFGYSFTTFGSFNGDFEQIMLGVVFDEYSEYSYEGGTFTLTGAKSGEEVLDMTARYDGDTDSLSFEVYEKDQLVFFFEYSRIPGGYAAQSCFDIVVESRWATNEHITGLCNFRVIFQGNNGSVARFDSINEKPESILGYHPGRQVHR